MAFRKPKDEPPDAERWLEMDASMTGTLTFKDPVNLQINGRFEGTLDTKGNLAIGEKANVKATIKGESIEIRGIVNGTVTASGRVELTPTARVAGKLISPRVIMQDGAVFDGGIEMTSTRGGGSWMTVEDLARYLEVDADTVGQWAQSGRLPAQKEGNQWRFDRTKIEDWLAQERIK